MALPAYASDTVAGTEHMLDEMRSLEDTLLHQQFRSEAELDDWLSDEFVEVSPAGKPASRAEVMQWLLQKDSTHRWRLSDWRVDEVVQGVRLVRYHAARLVPPSQSTGAVHCSLWCFDTQLQRWRLRFHQSSRVG